MKDHLTPKQVARAIGVSESSLKRWCDRGLVPMIRTAGGHRRLPLHGVLAFLRDSDYNLVDPTAIGLPVTSGRTERVMIRGKDRLRDALAAGKVEQCRQILFDYYLANHPISQICDEIITPAFHEIGSLWECAELDIYQERRGCQVITQTIFELRLAIPEPQGELVAIGGTLPGDPYAIPTMMVELVMLDRGWQATSLGTEIPATSLAQSIRAVKPDVFWLSVSAYQNEIQLRRDFEIISETAREHGTTLVVGGRALDEEVRPQLRYHAHCDTLQHLERFLETLEQKSTPNAAGSEKRNGMNGETNGV